MTINSLEPSQAKKFFAAAQEFNEDKLPWLQIPSIDNNWDSLGNLTASISATDVKGNKPLTITVLNEYGEEESKTLIFNEHSVEMLVEAVKDSIKNGKIENAVILANMAESGAAQVSSGLAYNVSIELAKILPKVGLGLG